MLTANNQYEHELKKRVDEERERLKDILEAGIAIKDYPQYQNYVGQLAAYNKVTSTFFEDVNTTLNKR